MLTAYLDESYNNRTFCVGGWILPEEAWTQFENDWRQRIELEQRNSSKKGFSPISRYHASDCASLLAEFDRGKGWDNDRQKRFSKKLLGIIAKHRPHGVVIGGSIDLFLKHFPEDKKHWREAMYYVSIALVMNELNEIRKAHYPSEKITIFYDGGKLSPMASKAFLSLKNDGPIDGEDVAQHFVTMAPLNWQDALLLQPADLLAFEGMKRVDGHLRGNNAIRKSFAALLGKRVDIGIAVFTDAYFREIKKQKMAYIAAMQKSRLR
jgi:hypothetical protein